MKRKRIIFISPHESGFIRQDRHILEEEYELLEHSARWSNKWLLPWNFFMQLLFLLWNIRKSSMVMVQFGGYASLIPSLLGKWFHRPVAIVLHGTDCADFPQLNYGNLRKPLMRWFCKNSYKNARILLPVSESLDHTVNSYTQDDPPIQLGLKATFPDLKTDRKVIYNGLAAEKWEWEDKVHRKPNRVISVMDKSQFTLKGGPLIIQVARACPDLEFKIVGAQGAVEESSLPSNLHLSPRISQEELHTEYLRSTVCLQLSHWEGFGLSLCEAMLCGCIPIVSNVNHMPAIVGEIGGVVTSPDPDLVEQHLRRVMDLQPEEQSKLSHAARQRILDNYSLEIRRKDLLKMVEELVS